MTDPKTLELAETILSVKIGELHTTELEVRKLCRALVERDTPVKIASPIDDCHHCGITSIQNWHPKYCPNCGHPLDWSEKA